MKGADTSVCQGLAGVMLGRGHLSNSTSIFERGGDKKKTKKGIAK